MIVGGLVFKVEGVKDPFPIPTVTFHLATHPISVSTSIISTTVLGGVG